MKNPLISVIVPVYNVEEYLEECINSILSSTYSNIEVLMVEDCSTDNSLILARELASKDSRIKLIEHTVNGGLSKARNTGMSLMCGEYLIFVDSDDFIYRDSIETLYKAIENLNADMVISGTTTYDTVSKLIVRDNYHNCNTLQVYRDNLVPTGYLMSRMHEDINVSAWAKIYKTSIIKDNNILYPDNLSFEDNVFFWHYTLLEGIKIGFINKPTYFYRFNRQSAITSNKNNLIDIFYIYKCLKNLAIVNNSVLSIYVKQWLLTSYIGWQYTRNKKPASIKFFDEARKYVLSGDLKISNILNGKQKKALKLLKISSLLAYYYIYFDFNELKSIIGRNFLSIKIYNILKVLLKKGGL